MNRLGADEEDLVGECVPDDEGLAANEDARRMEWPTASALEKVTDSPLFGRWETLFRDPGDARLWERTYPKGDMHGGDPPGLTGIAEEQARLRYGWSEPFDVDRR